MALAKINPKIYFPIAASARACGVCMPLVDARHTHTHTWTYSHLLLSHVFAMLLNEMVKIVILRTSSGFTQWTLCTYDARCSLSAQSRASSSSSFTSHRRGRRRTFTSVCNSSYFIRHQTLCIRTWYGRTGIGVRRYSIFVHGITLMKNVRIHTIHCCTPQSTLSIVAFNKRTISQMYMRRKVHGAACVTNRFIHQPNNFLTLVWRKSFPFLFVRCSEYTHVSGACIQYGEWIERKCNISGFSGSNGIYRLPGALYELRGASGKYLVKFLHRTSRRTIQNSPQFTHFTCSIATLW